MSKLDHFIDLFVKELENENAVVFAGAGLSVGAGFVDWKSLLRPIADELELSVDLEHDLVSLAQYHVNDKASRAGLTRVLIEEFTKGRRVTENHRILARLPIKTFWTTNYDSLIEDALAEQSKVADVKEDIQQLKHALPRRDAIVYKMHGDVRRPSEAIITKDDYERYRETHGPFVTALSGDLVSKTFLFLGFSFSDPNLDYILNRVRLSLHGQSHDHYCIFKEVSLSDYKTDEEFTYAKIKQKYMAADLKRFGIQTLFVKDYGVITTILRNIENRFKRRTVLISGSVHDYGDWNRTEADAFIRDLAQNLVKSNYRIVSGFGLGVGSSVIAGALEEVYFNERYRLHDQLILRPFPRGGPGQKNWEAYREDMIAHSGAAIFLFGNKLRNDTVVVSDGVIEEFKIAKSSDVKLIPVGATGFAAEILWTELMTNFEALYPNMVDLKPLFITLGKGAPRDRLVPTIAQILKALRSR